MGLAGGAAAACVCGGGGCRGCGAGGSVAGGKSPCSTARTYRAHAQQWLRDADSTARLALHPTAAHRHAARHTLPLPATPHTHTRRAPPPCTAAHTCRSFRWLRSRRSASSCRDSDCARAACEVRLDPAPAWIRRSSFSALSALTCRCSCMMRPSSSPSESLPLLPPPPPPPLTPRASRALAASAPRLAAVAVAPGPAAVAAAPGPAACGDAAGVCSCCREMAAAVRARLRGMVAGVPAAAKPAVGPAATAAALAAAASEWSLR